MKNTKLEILYEPHGFHLDVPVEAMDADNQKWANLLEEDPWKGVYELGFSVLPSASPSFKYLQRIAEKYVEKLTALPEIEIARNESRVFLDEISRDQLLEEVPFVLGSEYIDESWMSEAFENLNTVFAEDAKDFDGSMQRYFTQKSADIQTAERIYFHLVENPKNSDFPFAFLATYAAKNEEGIIRHLPLSNALKVYKPDDPRLLKMLNCLSQVCEVSDMMDEFITSGEIFHPLAMSADEAFRFLKSIEDIEKTGIHCRIPNWWKRKQSSVQLSVSMGAKKESLVGLESLISLTPSLSVDGEKLTQKDIKELLTQDEGLYMLKGKWVEVNHEKLHKLLEEMEQYDHSISFLEGLRMQNGLEEQEDEDIQITNGRWLSTLMSRLKNPAMAKNRAVPKTVHASLRDYQKSGYTWLENMKELGLGACLADDMGLGKTLQVLVFLEKIRKDYPDAKILLVAPASLLMNWKKEAEKFTPEMPVHILHGKSSDLLDEEIGQEQSFLTITTYGMASRLENLKSIHWDYLILDEAQAIKNPKTKQTKTMKAIPSSNRIALTGTPIENDLSNLWSLFDFLNKGLLGTSKEFTNYCKSLSDHPENYARLRNMISPFLLRRLKTDKSIIADLPDKIEKTEYVSLSKKQTALYLQQVSELEKVLASEGEDSGIQRKGRVLAAINKFKQICNHPDQFLDQKGYKPSESGKFEVLADVCATIEENHECVLIFTQYREIIPELDQYLEKLFGRKGFVIHGGTSVEKRQELVDAFNEQKTYIPYMILSLKAAGTGLNLTRANHVIHFDRWWNPAVENQATDRAYRIGQDKNVIVHKFICSGTIEEKIDEMIESKKELAEKVISANSESWITELSNDELLNMVRLSV